MDAIFPTEDDMGTNEPTGAGKFPPNEPPWLISSRAVNIEQLAA